MLTLCAQSQGTVPDFGKANFLEELSVDGNQLEQLPGAWQAAGGVNPFLRLLDLSSNSFKVRQQHPPAGKLYREVH